MTWFGWLALVFWTLNLVLVPFQKESVGRAVQLVNSLVALTGILLVGTGTPLL